MAWSLGNLFVNISMDSTRLSRDAKKAGKTVNGLEKDFKGLKSSVLSAQNVFAGMGGYLATQFAKDLWRTAVMVDQVNRAFMVIAGGGGGPYNARKELNLIRETAKELGQEFWSLTDSFKFIAAAAKDTALEGEGTRDIFRAVSEAGTALGLTNTQVKMSLYAISQMISKGTVNAEELRQQLGERLPGAYQAMARALGVTTKELNKMLEQGEVIATEAIPKLAKELSRMYAGPALLAADKPIGVLNRFKTAWIDLKTELSEGAFTEGAVQGLRELTSILKDEEVISSLKSIIEGIVNISAVVGDLAKKLLAILSKFEGSADTAMIGVIGRILFGSWGPGLIAAGIYEVSNAFEDLRKKIIEMNDLDPSKSAWTIAREEGLKKQIALLKEKINQDEKDAEGWRGKLFGSEVFNKQKEKRLEKLAELMAKIGETPGRGKLFDLTSIEPPVIPNWRKEYDLDFEGAERKLNWGEPTDKKALKELEKWAYDYEDYMKMASDAFDNYSPDWDGYTKDQKNAFVELENLYKKFADQASRVEEVMQKIQDRVKESTLEGLDLELYRIDKEFSEYMKNVPAKMIPELENMRDQLKQSTILEFEFKAKLDYQEILSQFEDLARTVQDVWDPVNYDIDYGPIDKVAAAIQREYEAQLKLNKELDYQLRLMEAVEDTYDLDSGVSPENILDEIKAQNKEFENLEKQSEDTFNFMLELTEHTANKMQDTFSNVFFDSVTGELKDFADYADAIFKSVARAWSDIMGQMMAQSIFGKDFKGGGWLSSLGDLFSTNSTGFSGNATDLTGAFSGDAQMAFAGGGYIGEKVRGMGLSSGKSYEFHPNEFVVPSDSLGGGSNVQVIINEAPPGTSAKKQQQGDITQYVINLAAGSVSGHTALGKAIESTYGLSRTGRRA